MSTTPHNKRHGMWQTKTYYAWIDMRQRCLNPNNWHYRWYGARGITIDPSWDLFENFLRDLGEKPAGKFTLERKDVNGPYCKMNCCWLPQSQQARNRRNNRKLTFKGETKIVIEWAEYFGIAYTALSMRLHRGWSVEKALTTPYVTNRS